jgi:hypothetical protein
MRLATVKVLPLPVTPEQGLMRQTVLQAGRQGADGVRLIAGGLEAGAKLKGLARLHGRLVGA